MYDVCGFQWESLRSVESVKSPTSHKEEHIIQGLPSDTTVFGVPQCDSLQKGAIDGF